MSTINTADHRAILDHTLQKDEARIMTSPNKLKIGVFGPNLSGGTGGLTTLEGPPVMGNWDEARGLAVAADKAGFEALVPITRWKGFNGKSGFWDRSLETFTWAAALAEATENIHIFTSCMVPMVHPVLAAKMGATIDHVAKGRWGLNVVSGWVMEEFRMFGLPEVGRDDRYAYAEEWIDVVTRLWTETEPFDFKGRFFDLEGLVSSPKPMTQPRPTIMNAGMSPAGQAFAMRNADMIFIQIHHDEAAKTIQDLRDAAAAKGREISIWATAHIVCKPTEREAFEYVVKYAEQNTDDTAGQGYAATLLGSDSTSHAKWRADPALVRSLAASGGNMPIVGTPETVVAELARLSELGLDGIALAWVDYDEGVQQFSEELQPLLKDLGLRS
jgi:alkanesulfonate monooxygenase SsuD/methylene tetrahydromethanopterin reductase-like flavin-dependent oxidoreductase (luciferase family)